MRKPKKRTTLDLIHELDAEAKRFTTVLLAVGFEKTSTFIRSNDDNRHQALNDAISEGGTPVALIGLITVCNADRMVSKVTLYARLLQEYVEEDWAREYLERVVAAQGRALAAVQGATDYESKPGWMN
jgi:hypothetical protein